MNIYVCKSDTIVRSDRDSRIKEEFNGANYKFLAHKYDLSERHIRLIVSDELVKIRNEPLPEQLEF